jgi:hypothetical protein
MKNSGWIPFISGALIGAGITWLFTSKEGKEIVEQIGGKGKDLKGKLDEELADLQEKLEEWSHKQKTT